MTTLNEPYSPKKWPAPETLLALLPAHVRSPDPDVYLSDNYVTLDFETTTRDFGTPHDPENTIILASWKLGPSHPSRGVLPGISRRVGSAYDMGPLVEAIEAADFFIAHHSKFECGWLERCGMDLAKMLPFCTKIAEKTIAGNRPWGLHLDDCLKRRGWKGKDAIGKLIRLGVDTLDIPIKWLGKYCDADVRQTEALFLDQRRDLVEMDLLGVAFSRNILTPVLYDIEDKGLHLDKRRVGMVYDYYLNEEARQTLEWNELTGGVNPKSGPQKIALLYDELKLAPAKDERGREMKTDGGAYQTGEPALLRLVPKTKRQKEVVGGILALTKVRDALSKYVGNLKACVDAGGILHGEFVQTTASTGRLSSKGGRYKIQLQNFQRKFRPVVRARIRGWLIGDGDSSGIEFRTAVDLAKDPQGIKDIEDGVDIHVNTARVLFPDEWKADMDTKTGRNGDLRQAAKPSTFKPLYGGQSGTPAQLLYFAAFRKRYAATADMQRGWTETVLRDKELRTPTGARFYWPYCKLSRDGKYIKYTTNIYDYPIQYLATGEMLPTSTVYLWHMMRVTAMQSFLIDIVHDSAVGEIHPDEKEQWGDYLKYCFNVLIVWYLKKVYDYDWVTPLASDVVFGDYWGKSDADWEDQWAPQHDDQEEEL